LYNKRQSWQPDTTGYMTEADLYKFLIQCKLGVLGTIGEANTPQSALVGIAVTEDLEIVFDTVKTSRKYPNLIARPACSFVMGWAGEKTVQYEGRRFQILESAVPGLDGLVDAMRARRRRLESSTPC
jgi:hypothetical protein